MTILVTGGAGYIGSHTVRALQRQGLQVVVLDNLVYGHRQIVEQVLQVPLVVGQVGDRPLLDQLLSGEHPATAAEPIEAVLHFAAYAYVGESVADPARYYRNNLGDSLTLLEALLAEGQRRGGPPLPLVFSSTCASYGIPDPDQIPIAEACPQRPINSYGRSKWMVEQLIADFAAAYGLPSVIFRYFNAAGATEQHGEHHRIETHLIPNVLKVALGQKEHCEIYGTDYPTPDGTCIRDYIHVVDLAEAHILALQPGIQGAFNLGTGTGCSVRQIIRTCEEVTGKSIPTITQPRRIGDPPELVASPQRTQVALNWKPRFTKIQDIIGNAWNWQKAHPQGYAD